MKESSLYVKKLQIEFVVYQSMVSNVNAFMKPKYLDFSKCYQIITKSK